MDLIDAVGIMWRFRFVILMVTLLALAGGVLYGFLYLGSPSPKPQKLYRAEATLLFAQFIEAPAATDKASLTATSYAQVAEALLRPLASPASRQSLLAEPELQGLEIEDAIRQPLESISWELDRESPFIMRIFASSEQQELATQTMLTVIDILEIMLARTTESSSSSAPFQILYGPILQARDVAPESSTRQQIVVAVGSTLTGLLIGISLSFILNFVGRIRRDPEAIARIRGSKEKRSKS